MSRNASGLYSLPAGNPVVALTQITVTWGNTTMSDIGNELTNSLDRQGRGAMQAALKAFDGTVAAPGYTWGTETVKGLYSPGAGLVGMSIASTEVMRWSAGQFSTALGTLGAPSHSFTGDLNTGMFSPGADSVALVAGGVQRVLADATGVTLTGTLTASGTLAFTGPLSLALGAVGAPAYTFTGDTNTGFYSPGAEQIAATANGADVSRWSAGQFSTVLGAVGTPSHSFIGDLNTGMYSPGADQVAMSANGADVSRWSAGQFSTVLGTVGAPSHSFIGDLNTGFYSPGADQIAASTAGAQRWLVSAAGNHTFNSVATGAVALINVGAGLQGLQVAGGAATNVVVLTSNGTTTGSQSIQMLNTSGGLTMGIETSVGASLGFTGAPAYGATIGSTTTNSLSWGVGTAVRATLNNSGQLNLLAGTGTLKMAGLNTVSESAEQTCPTASANVAVNFAASSPARRPDALHVVLRCLIAEQSWAVGDEVVFEKDDSGATDRIVLPWASSTQYGFVWQSVSSFAPALRNKTTFAIFTATVANWRVVLRAIWL
jgi:hypothetical protein